MNIEDYRRYEFNRFVAKQEPKAKSIDDKLREILRSDSMGSYARDVRGDFIPIDSSKTPDKYYEDTIAQIKQAFKEECWVDITNFHNALANANRKSGLMSGQEWYDRFEKELHGHIQLLRDDVLDAAKRAAGLDTQDSEERTIPRYDLGFMLRKLPETIPTSTAGFNLTVRGGTWIARYGSKGMWAMADTPEDAACLLLIKLIEEGIIHA